MKKWAAKSLPKNVDIWRYIPYPLLICTWFLENQFGKIKFGELDFWSISNWISTACIACKNQFRNWFLQVKNPVCRNLIFQLDFSKTKYRWIGRKAIWSSIWIFKTLIFEDSHLVPISFWDWCSILPQGVDIHFPALLYHWEIFEFTTTFVFGNGCNGEKWYFVTKIVLTYCEKKLF